MLLENQQLHQTFFELYIYQGNILLKKDLQKQLCLTFLEFHTDQEQNQFLSLIAFRNKFFCMRVIINCFVKHFLILVAFRNRLQCSPIFQNNFTTHLKSQPGETCDGTCTRQHTSKSICAFKNSYVQISITNAASYTRKLSSQ